MEPIVGRTHTDLFRTRKRLTNIGGRGGLKLTYFSANGFSYAQFGIFIVSILVWTAPMMRLGVPFIAWGGMSTGLLLGPPLVLAWAADRTLPHGKTLLQWCTTRFRHRVLEKPYYVAGTPRVTSTTVINCLVWTPNREGLDV